MGAAERGQIKDGPITVNLKQLFPALKCSLLTFLTMSYAFSNTFSCLRLHTVVFKTLAISKSRWKFLIYRNLEKLSLLFFYTFQISLGYIFGKHILKHCIKYLHTQKAISHRMLHYIVYT